jgi:hypothetical protein
MQTCVSHGCDLPILAIILTSLSIVSGAVLPLVGMKAASLAK